MGGHPFNDLFILTGTHVSARYRIRFDGKSENHSSCGIIVSTGAGSTGSLLSVFDEPPRHSVFPRRSPRTARADNAVSDASGR